MSSDVAVEAAPAGSDRKRWVIGLVLIVGLGLFGLTAMKSSLATYTHDFTEVARKPGELLQVPGVVDRAAPQKYDTAAGWFEFTVLDVEQQSDRLLVRTRRVKPGNFDEASQVVCRGIYHPEGWFEARDLLVKCPSKEMDKMRAAEAPK